MSNKDTYWQLLCFPAVIFILMDSQNMGPTDITLILHEVGHGIFAFLFTFQIPELRFDFERGAGLCSPQGGTFFFLYWIIYIMGAGFQNITGAYLYKISKPKGVGHVLRAMGLTLYIVGWFDLNFDKDTISTILRRPNPADFAEDPIPKMILYLLLNYYLIRYVIAKGVNGSLYREFMIQAGYRKRSDYAPQPAREVRKRNKNTLWEEFLYQSGLRKRPY